MLKRILPGVLFFLCVTAVYAQRPTGAPAGLNESRFDMMSAHSNVAMPGQASLTEEDVGDADSFGKKKIYLGVSQTLPVIILADCTGFDPASGVCIEHAAPPGVTAVDETDLGMIDLPMNATKSLLCFTFTQFSSWSWANSTGAQQTGRMGLFLTTQVENDALVGLNDGNGNPFNGSLFLDNTGVPTPIGIIVSTSQTTLPDGAFEVQRERTTRSCTGGIVSARALRAQGLAEPQIKKFFNTAMTVKFGIAGSVSMTDFVRFNGGIRIYGDQ